MDLLEFCALLREEKMGEVRMNEPLFRHTTWRIGGPADIFYLPDTPQACARVLRLAEQHGIPVSFLGAGSNILVADEGVKGLVIKTTRLKNISWDGPHLIAGAGISLPFLCREAYKRGLGGMEFAAGIPGTLGGGVVMNAGAHGSSLESVVMEVRTLTKLGDEKNYSNRQAGFRYRGSTFRDNGELVVEARLGLRPGNPAEIKEAMKGNLRFSREKQPLDMPSAGSVFRNPPGDSAGRLIEAVGAKGWRAGDAMVSRKHANFIVNMGQATACDVLKLVEEVREAVKTKFSIDLETEVILLGFYDNRR